MLHKEKDAKATQGTGFKCYVGNRMQMLHNEQDAIDTHSEQDRCKSYKRNRMQVLLREQDASAT